MDFYEELTQMHLTVTEGCFVLPQAPLRQTLDGKDVWVAYPDFVALDFKKKRILVVEVTKGWHVSLAPKLIPEHRDRAEQLIRQELLNKLLDDWPIAWRFFVRRARMKQLQATVALRQYVEQGGDVQVIALEDVFD